MTRPTGWMSLAIVILLVVLLVVGLKPYLNGILAALVFGPPFRPVYLRILSKVKRPAVAAWCTLALILALVIGPLTTLGILAYQETRAIADQYQNLAPGALDFQVLGQSPASLVQQGAEKIVGWMQASLGSIFSETVRVLVSCFIMIYLLYYLLIEEESLMRVVQELLPFEAKDSQKLIDKFGRMSRGFLYGQGITALVQGVLGGIGLLIFGFPGAFLWAMVMTALSLIPVLGAFLIWVPAGILQIVSGQTLSGVGILVWGVVVVSFADNLLRPILMRNLAGVHPVITLLGVFAGISLFGLIGIIVGPLLFGLVLETARMFYRDQAESSP
jgi:predicted PurR-regulated permease PerM